MQKSLKFIDMKKKILFIFSVFMLFAVQIFANPAQRSSNTMRNFVISTIPPQVYTGADITPSFTIRDGRALLQRDVDYTVEYRNNRNAGTATMIIKGVPGGNYSESITKEFTIEKARLVVLADDKLGKAYGYPDPLLTFRVRSGELKGNDQFTGSLMREPGETIGSYLISLGTLNAGPNYELALVGTSYFTIHRAPITIRATPQTKAYGTPDPLLRYSIVEGTMRREDRLTGEPGRMPGESVGKYAITQGTLSANENYEIRFIRDHLEITPQFITVKADQSRKIFGEPDQPLTYRITAGRLADGELLRGQLTREPGEDVGKYNIRQGTLSAGDNYNLTFIPDVFEIVQKPLNRQ